MLGPHQRVELRLLDIAPMEEALKGVVMEIDDCAFPLVAGVESCNDRCILRKRPQADLQGSPACYHGRSFPTERWHGAQGFAGKELRYFQGTGAGSRPGIVFP